MHDETPSRQELLAELLTLQQRNAELEQRFQQRSAELLAANGELRKQHLALHGLLRASDCERQLIAYEIHDGLAQQLAAAIMHFQAYEAVRQLDAKQSEEAYCAGLLMLRQAHGEARRLLSGVRPPVLEESGVLVAIEQLVEEMSTAGGPVITVRTQVSFERLAAPLENSLFRIVQEALNNACRHSHSQQVRVNIVQRDDQIRLEIRDWGVGFSPADVPDDRFGLRGLRRRARLLGGAASIRSAPGQGTLVRVRLPVAEAS